MTARPALRRRSTWVAGIVGLVLVIVAAGLTLVGANAVINSTAGEEVAGDERPVVALPSTDNAAIAVVDDAGRLTSLVVMTLLPAGVGGSIVTVPVDADASAGFGDTRRPLSSIIDPTDPAAFFASVEEMLAISLQYGDIVSEPRFASLIEPVAPIEGSVAGAAEPVLLEAVDIADALGVDASADESLEADEPVEPVDEADGRSLHDIDVEIWSALAANAPVATSTAVPLDEFDRPKSAASLDEVVGRLWQGEVSVRDLEVQSLAVADDGTDAVVLDPRDVLLVFALTSPGRVSTPNAGSVVRIEAPFSEEQIISSGGRFTSSSEVVRLLIGELLFVSANTVSVDTSPSSDGAAAVTRVEVANERLLQDIEILAPLIFGPVEIVVASTLIEGVDVVVRLGTGYIDLKARQATVATGDTVDADG